jgi:hypothetical protein
MFFAVDSSSLRITCASFEKKVRLFSLEFPGLLVLGRIRWVKVWLPVKYRLKSIDEFILAAKEQRAKGHHFFCFLSHQRSQYPDIPLGMLIFPQSAEMIQIPQVGGQQHPAPMGVGENIRGHMG